MSERTGYICFLIVAGAMGGFYVACGYEWYFHSLSWHFPTSSMIWMPLAGVGLALCMGVEECPESVESEEVEAFQIPIYVRDDTSYNIAIEHMYPASQVDLIQERMHLIRTGRLKMRGKNYGDTFKDLMDGSDTPDT